MLSVCACVCVKVFISFSSLAASLQIGDACHIVKTSYFSPSYYITGSATDCMLLGSEYL